MNISSAIVHARPGHAAEVQHALAAGQVRLQLLDHVAVDLADARLGQLHDLADLAHGQALVVVHDHDQALLLGEVAGDQVEDVLLLHGEERVDPLLLVRQEVSAPFAMLADGWDIVMTPSRNQGDDLMWHIGEAEQQATLEVLGYRPLALQCGVMWIARNERTLAFFDAWHEEWMRYCDEDQAAFLRALARGPLKVWLLGLPWNGGAIIEHRFGACRS